MDVTTEDTQVTLGDLLKRARKDAHLEMQELAEKIGVSRNTISAWERDRTQPGFEYVRRIIEVCDSPWLLTAKFRSSKSARIGWFIETAGQGARDVAA